MCCSTPEGVIVLVTRRRRQAPVQILLNARRRHRLGHTRPGSTSCWATAAQRPKASSSRSLRRLGADNSPPDRPAQRPKASSSWSPIPASRLRHHRVHLLNARRRHRLGHHVAGRVHGRPDDLLNARRRHRLRHSLLNDDGSSRPRLLNARRRHRLGHAVPPPWRPRRSRSAQRPKASSSWSRDGASRSTGDPAACSTPEGVIVLVTRGRTVLRGAILELLNARRRHRLDHAVPAVSHPRPFSPAQRPKASSS